MEDCFYKWYSQLSQVQRKTEMNDCKEKLKPLCIVGGTVKQYSHSGKIAWQFLKKLNTKLLMY